MVSLLVTSQAVRCRGGMFQGTMLSKRNGHYGKGRRLAPNTFILEGVSDKGHPCFSCNAAELVRLLNGFGLFLWVSMSH